MRTKTDRGKPVCFDATAKVFLPFGEIVCLDANGASQFSQLLNRGGQPILYTFDLLWLNGEDLRRMPLMKRKQRLERFLRSSRGQHIMYAQHIENYGKKFFEGICLRDLEGIVAKRKLGIYKDGRRDWLKVKNRTYFQAQGRHELLTNRPSAGRK